MANQLLKGRSFAPGDTVDAADLNNLVDLGTALEGIISAQGALVTPAPTDQLLLLRPGTPNTLKRGAVSALPTAGTVTSVGMTVAPSSVLAVAGTPGNPITTAGTLALTMKPQAPQTFLAGPVSGANTAPAFRQIAVSDVNEAHAIPLFDIDLTQGNVFFKHLTDTFSHVFTFVTGTGTAGQTFKVWIQRDVASVGLINWSVGGGTLRWPGGVKPEMTTGSGATDIFEFVCITPTLFYGTRWGADFRL